MFCWRLTYCMPCMFRMCCSTITWKSTSTLMPYASLSISLSVFCFLRSSIFFLLSSLFCFKRSISSKHEDFFDPLAIAGVTLMGLFVPSFNVESFTGTPCTCKPRCEAWKLVQNHTIVFFESFLSFIDCSESRKLFLLELINDFIVSHGVDLLLLFVVDSLLHLFHLV